MAAERLDSGAICCLAARSAGDVGAADDAGAAVTTRSRESPFRPSAARDGAKVNQSTRRASSLPPTSGKLTAGAFWASPYSQWTKTSQVPRPGSLLKNAMRRSAPGALFPNAQLAVLQQRFGMQLPDDPRLDPAINDWLQRSRAATL